MTEKEAKAKLKEIKKAMESFPREVRRQEWAHREEMKIRKAFGKLSIASKKPKKLPTPIHPWRLCPPGQFYRKKHSQRSYTRANGVQVRASIHPNECVVNETGKDQLYAAEIQEIAARNFGVLKDLPTANALPEYKDEDKFNAFIAGWVKYWNDVLQPNDPLDVNFVKALIATESSFDPQSWNGLRGKGRARGLMQVTDGSVKLLSNRSKELKDHFVNLKVDDMLDPNLTICAGIRWLFRKKELVKSKKPTWTEAVMVYKSYPSVDAPQMKKFLSIYGKLKNK